MDMDGCARFVSGQWLGASKACCDNVLSPDILLICYAMHCRLLGIVPKHCARCLHTGRDPTWPGLCGIAGMSDLRYLVRIP